MTTKLIQELVGLAVEKSATTKKIIRVNFEVTGAVSITKVSVGEFVYIVAYVVGDDNAQLKAAIDKVKAL